MAEIVETKGFGELAVDFRRTAEGLAVEVPKMVAESATVISDRAKSIVLSYPTKGTGEAQAAIAASIRPRPRKKNVWVVEAGEAGTPLAGLWEMGNKGGRSGEGAFRHPVFGNKTVWVTQEKWPYLTRAVQELEAPVTEKMIVDVFNVFRKHRL